MNALDLVVGCLQLTLSVSTAFSSYEIVESAPPPSNQNIPYIQFADPSESRPREAIVVERCKILDEPGLKKNLHLDFTEEFSESGKDHSQIIIVTGSGFDPEPFQAMHSCFYIYSDQP
mgnify:CR=1 FL=1